MKEYWLFWVEKLIVFVCVVCFWKVVLKCEKMWLLFVFFWWLFFLVFLYVVGNYLFIMVDLFLNFCFVIVIIINVRVDIIVNVSRINGYWSVLVINFFVVSMMFIIGIMVVMVFSLMLGRSLVMVGRMMSMFIGVIVDWVFLKFFEWIVIGIIILVKKIMSGSSSM